jgi:hypothetical protein
MTYKIYLIGWNEKPIKIGMTSNVKKRLKGLQTSCPYKLRCFGTRTYPNKAMAKKAESMLHEAFDEFRLEGEWFDLTAGYVKIRVDSILGIREPYNEGNHRKHAPCKL